MAVTEATSNTKRKQTKTITLGSGHIYYKEYSGTLPDTATICTEANRLGYISGGAHLEYSNEVYTATDDLGIVKKTKITTETVTLGTGLATWNGDSLAVLLATGRTEIKANRRITKIGGLDNDNGKSYVVCFHHPDKKDGDLWVTIVGKNTNGLTLDFAKDAESVVEALFTAEPSDDSGTLVVIEEEIQTTGT